MASTTTADLNQISHNQWMGALREWEKAELDEELYGAHPGTGFTRLYILKGPSGISLLAAQPNHKNEALEKLSTVDCIELTEKFLSNFVLAHEYEDISRIWKYMAHKISDGNEQISRINLLIKETEETARILHLSLQTARNDRMQDFLTKSKEASIISFLPESPLSSPKEEESSEEDIYGGNTSGEEHFDNSYWLNKSVVVLSTTEAEPSEEDLYAPSSYSL